MLSYYVIYYEKFKNIMQQTEKEALNISVIYNISDESNMIHNTNAHSRILYTWLMQKTV